MQPQTKQPYQPETAGSIMSTGIPTAEPGDTFGHIIGRLSAEAWDDIEHVYVIDGRRATLGYINVAALTKSDPSVRAETLMRPVGVSLKPDDDQEKAVWLAVKNDLDSIPVTDDDNHFLGVVTSRAIINVMHEERLEDTLISAGIRGRGSHIIKLASGRMALIIKSRAPWLIVGTLVAISLGLISSQFEASLEKTIALAYFTPVVAYIADAIGTQSEAITVRALAVLKLSNGLYLMRELAVGLILGTIVGFMGLVGATLISRSVALGWVVGLSLLVASTIAAVLAALIPMTFRKLGKDPALGSGPLATALQDVISVVVYFLFGLLLIH